MIQKGHPYTANLNSETSGDSNDAYLHFGDVNFLLCFSFFPLSFLFFLLFPCLLSSLFSCFSLLSSLMRSLLTIATCVCWCVEWHLFSSASKSACCVSAEFCSKVWPYISIASSLLKARLKEWMLLRLTDSKLAKATSCRQFCDCCSWLLCKPAWYAADELLTQTASRLPASEQVLSWYCWWIAHSNCIQTACLWPAFSMMLPMTCSLKLLPDCSPLTREFYSVADELLTQIASRLLASDQGPLWCCRINILIFYVSPHLGTGWHCIACNKQQKQLAA